MHFGGWNTKADGTGTHYDVGAALNLTSSLELYAEWQATLTYNGNTSTSGTVPSPTIAKSSDAVTVLSGNTGNLAKTGHTFKGWNTAPDGTGTAYAAGGNLNGLPTPYMRFTASDFNTSTTAWLDSSGNNRTVLDAATTGSITKITTTAGQNATSKAFVAVRGDITAKVTFPNAQLNTYTFCHVSRYAGANRQRIFTHSSVNWVSGYLSGSTGSYYGQAPTGSNSGTVSGATNDLSWHVYCDYNSYFRNNGTSSPALSRSALPVNFGIATWSNQQSDWEVAEILVYSSTLTLTQIQQIEGYLKDTYGLTAATVPASAIGTTNFAATGDITLYAQWVS